MILLVGIGLAALWGVLALIRHRAKRPARLVGCGDVAGLAGLNESVPCTVIGVARPIGEPLTAPLSGRPCLWFRSTVFQTERSGGPSVADEIPVLSAESHVSELEITDVSGTAVVRPGSAEVVNALTVLDDTQHGVKRHEEILPIGETTWVIGGAHRASDGSAQLVPPHGGHDFIIGAGDEPGDHRHQRTARNSFLAAAVLLAVVTLLLVKAIGDDGSPNRVGAAIGSGFLIALSAACLFSIRRNRRFKQTIDSAHTIGSADIANIAADPPEPCEVVGVAGMDGPELLSPLTKTPCVWYQVRAGRRRAEPQAAAGRGEADQPTALFTVTDVSGTISVRPTTEMRVEGADQALLAQPDRTHHIAGLERRIRTAELRTPGIHDVYEEWVLPRGALVYVLGGAGYDADDQPVVTAAKERPFVVTRHSETDLRARFLGNIGLDSGLAIVSATVALIWLLAAFVG